MAMTPPGLRMPVGVLLLLHFISVSIDSEEAGSNDLCSVALG